MAAQERLLDVWLIDLNEVYSAVPFTVVADWLQQGRLLAADRVRLVGNKKWHNISAVPALTPYLPRAEPMQAEDRAEALEPVDLGFEWRRPHEDEDEDVDMIPLIDISLVLLIFFMMTASVSGVLSPIDTPAARHKLDEIAKDSYWVGIETRARGGAVEKDSAGRPLPWYSLGRERSESVQPTRSFDDVAAALAQDLGSRQGEITIRLRADRNLPIEAVRDVTLELQGVERRLNAERDAGRRLQLNIVGEVSEPQES